jgi:hypothetical protein
MLDFIVTEVKVKLGERQQEIGARDITNVDESPLPYIPNLFLEHQSKHQFTCQIKEYACRTRIIEHEGPPRTATAAAAATSTRRKYHHRQPAAGNGDDA